MVAHSLVISGSVGIGMYLNMVTPAKLTFHLLHLEHSWVDEDGKRLRTVLHLII